MTQLFGRKHKVVLGQTSPEDALSAADYPASGSFVDVSAYEYAYCFVHMGAINGGDTPSLTVKAADSISGTLDVIDATYCTKEVAADDDDECVLFTVEVRKLALDHHFLSCVVADVTNGSYGEIIWFLQANSQPVTQTTTVLPTASNLVYAG